MADAVEMSLAGNTPAYFYIWWGFRITELLWLAFATCYLIYQLTHPVLDKYTHHFCWTPLVVSAFSVLACGRWETNTQMELLQSFILISCALPVWMYAFIFWSLRILPYALGVLMSGEILCTLLWRYAGYHIEGWFLVWITGMVMLWIADRADRK